MRRKIMPKQVIPWTDELIKEIIRLLDEGKSSREAATILNISGNALIGKLHRMGIKVSDHNHLTKNLNTIPIRVRPRLKPLRPDIVRIVKEREMKKLKAPAKPHLKSTAPPVPLPKFTKPELTERACDILELDKGRCHWPMWEDDETHRLYCGEPIDGCTPYCSGHHYLSLPPYLRPVSGFGDEIASGKVTKIN
jgi:hypothetical protein